MAVRREPCQVCAGLEWCLRLAKTEYGSGKWQRVTRSRCIEGRKAYITFADALAVVVTHAEGKRVDKPRLAVAISRLRHHLDTGKRV